MPSKTINYKYEIGSMLWYTAHTPIDTAICPQCKTAKPVWRYTTVMVFIISINISFDNEKTLILYETVERETGCHSGYVKGGELFETEKEAKKEAARLNRKRGS